MTRVISMRWLVGAVTAVLWGCGGGDGSGTVKEMISAASSLPE